MSLGAEKAIMQVGPGFWKTTKVGEADWLAWLSLIQSALRALRGFSSTAEPFASGGLFRIATQVVDQAAAAFGPASLAHVAPVQDQPVMGV